jgi:hypothetical protein
LKPTLPVGGCFFTLLEHELIDGLAEMGHSQLIQTQPST